MCVCVCVVACVLFVAFRCFQASPKDACLLLSNVFIIEWGRLRALKCVRFWLEHACFMALDVGRIDLIVMLKHHA